MQTDPFASAPQVIGAILNPGLAAGGYYRVGDKTVQLARVNDNGTVDLIDQVTGHALQIRCEDTGDAIAPTIAWLRERYRAGDLVPIDAAKTAADRQGRMALLDPDSRVDADPKSSWRFSLASRAMADEVPLTDADCNEWLERQYGRDKQDLSFKRPSGNSLRRWIRQLKNKGKKASNLAFQAGRSRGHSQLDPVLDAFTHQAAVYYWSRPRISITEAYAWLKAKLIERYVSMGVSPADGECPSFETVRKRIHRLRCFDTVKTKHGEEYAKLLFQGSGEPFQVEDLLELAYMDATTLEQVIVFDEDWKLPACRVRIVALMDCRSHAILGFHVYAGPNRAETSIEALIAAITFSEVPEEELREHPMLAWIGGKPAAILPDNEKALIGPSTLPADNEAGITLLSPPIEMPTAKAELERWFGTLKTALKAYPGTLVDPKQILELGNNSVDSAWLTLPQLREEIAKQVARYNTHPQKGLGGQSPVLVWERLSKGRALLQFHDTAHLRRVLGRTGTALLTRDGVELNSIRYRDRALVTQLLDNMAHTQKVRGRRKDGSITIEIKYRVSPGNLDTLQVFDRVASTWVTLPSTQPRYTANLSEWEHREFTRQAKRRNEPHSTEDQRLRSKMKTLRDIDAQAPHVSFQQRRDMAALYISQKTKQLAGSAAKLPPSMPYDAISLADQVTLENDRPDEGLPPKLSGNESDKVKRPEAPPRPANYGGYEASPELTAEDWEGLDEPEMEDPETGVTEPIELPEEPMEDDQ